MIFLKYSKEFSKYFINIPDITGRVLSRAGALIDGQGTGNAFARDPICVAASTDTTVECMNEIIFNEIAVRTSDEGRAARVRAAQWTESTGEVGQNLETLNAYNSVHTKL